METWTVQHTLPTSRSPAISNLLLHRQDVRDNLTTIPSAGQLPQLAPDGLPLLESGRTISHSQSQTWNLIHRAMRQSSGSNWRDGNGIPVRFWCRQLSVYLHVLFRQVNEWFKF